VEPCPYTQDEVLEVIEVEPLSESSCVIVLEDIDGLRHRAKCGAHRENPRVEPLKPGDMVNVVKAKIHTQAIVERVTAGQGDGCVYLVHEFQRLSPPA
jgi:hypothetical protein